MAGHSLWADEGLAPDSDSGYTGLALAVVGDLSADQVERVRAFMELNTAIPVTLRETDAIEADTLGGVADALVDLRDPADAALILLYAGEQDFAEHAVYRYEQGVGIINARLMRTEDEEIFLRRLERLGMRSAGLLLDVPLVPNPQSAMWTYQTMEHLDFMGRNFDPPSLKAIQENAQALGIRLNEDSPFLIIRSP